MNAAASQARYCQYVAIDMTTSHGFRFRSGLRSWSVAAARVLTWWTGRQHEARLFMVDGNTAWLEAA